MTLTNYKTRNLDILVYPGFKALEAIGPMSVFEYANLHLVRRHGLPGYDIRVASLQIGSVRSDTLMAIDATKKLSDLSLPNDVIIVGAREIDAALSNAEVIVDWLAKNSKRIDRVAALCSGAFFLAAAGLLNNKRATTHWSVADRLKRQYPLVQVESDAIFIRQDNLWTSAGVTAGIDLALAFVEEDHGREIALEVASELVVYLKRPGGQSQFSNFLINQRSSHTTIESIQAWILANLSEKITLSVLAAKANMSVRNFTRVFLQEIGHSPHEYIEMARFEMAKQLLTDLNLPIKTVASRSGFGGQERLRKVCQKRAGITPTVYRERFATTGVMSQTKDHENQASSTSCTPMRHHTPIR